MWNIAKKTARGVALATGVVAAVAFVSAPEPAHALNAGEGVAIGLGSFALGSAMGAASNPYGNGYYYAAPPAYYAPPAPAYYYQPRSCWDPYRRYYYAC